MPTVLLEVLELHDSDLLAVSADASHVRVRLQAYIHRVPAHHGESGTGWTQLVELIFEQARVEETIAELPCQLTNGEITGALNADNLIALPCKVEGMLQFAVTDSRGRAVRIQAMELLILRLDDPTFVEVTPAELYSNLNVSGLAE